jgi:hypothetical protein
MTESNFKIWSERLLIIFLVCFFGLLAINQAIEYRYKSVFLQTPCSLCSQLNPNVSICIYSCFNTKKNVYPTSTGDWIDDAGICYGITGNIKNCSGEKINMKLNISSLEDIKIFSKLV